MAGERVEQPIGRRAELLKRGRRLRSGEQADQSPARWTAVPWCIPTRIVG
jgi:hypothetical protein